MRATTKPFQVGDWVVEPMLNQARHGSEFVRLEPKVMEVLLCLAERPGEVVRKDELIQQVWPDTFVSDQVLTHAVWQLRQAFNSQSDSEFIQTIPKRGYRLTAIVREPSQEPRTAVSSSDSGEVSDVAAATFRPQPRKGKQVKLWVIAGLPTLGLVLALILLKPTGVTDWIRGRS